ncbi:hypothetical protein GGI07_000147 [Coemansia sp. Benny D115]|nr:hypothetical protein GGI07_000147 [Coemansia sp. Benny D115]
MSGGSSNSIVFNEDEIQSYISKGWLDAKDKLSGLNSASGNRGGSTMENQKDFLVELRRQLKDLGSA